MTLNNLVSHDRSCLLLLYMSVTSVAIAPWYMVSGYASHVTSCFAQSPAACLQATITVPSLRFLLFSYKTHK